MNKGKFSGILICSDLDGTLLNSRAEVSPENIEAIGYFMQNGGAFSFITGRSKMAAARFCDILHPNVPIGCINGGAICDKTGKEYIEFMTLDRGAEQLMNLVINTVPEVGIRVDTAENTYFIRDSHGMKIARERIGYPFILKTFGEIEEPISKIVFGSDNNEVILKTDALLRADKRSENYELVRSGVLLYELLPKGINKGAAMEKIAKLSGVDMRRTIAVGDYDNDLPMLKKARIGVAPKNACREALKAADYIGADNDSHIIADIVSKLSTGEITI